MLFLEALKLIFLLVFVFFFHLELKCQIFVRCICEENELLFHTKISEIRHNGSFLVTFFGFFWGRDAILDFIIKSS